jgi:5'-3' exonuclease
MLSLLGQRDVSHVAIAFDHVVESFRNEMFDGYKTGEGLEPELHDQFPLAEQAAEALGLVVWPMVKFEADDGLASGAHVYSKDSRVEQIVICTPDKDLMQCVQGKRIVSWDRVRDKWYDEQGVKAKFGIEPRTIPDWLGLVGDTADGIPGIPKWGAKSSTTVLAHYGSIKNIPEDPETWEVKPRGAKGLSENLNAMRKEADLYRELATLRIDAPLPETLDDLQWQGAYRDKLEALCEKLGDQRFVERVKVWR